MAQGIPHDIAVERGICGAQRRNEDAPCQGPRDDKGRSICGRHCGAKNRQGYPCSQHCKGSNGRCRNHGADSPAGPGSPRWVDGTSSKYAAVFSGNALEHYEAARKGNPTDLSEEVYFLDTLIIEEAIKAKIGQGGPLWAELGDIWQMFQAAQPTKDATTAGRCLRRMGEIITEGSGRYAAQTEAKDLVERKRKVSESERRRILDEQQTITQQQAMAFVGAVVASVRKHVDDRQALANISADITRLVHQDVSGVRGGAGATL